ncbi:F0F1 ATP synthase subunit delta [Microbacterium sp. cx-55]|uniref:F0F1 ATP synthase subunit delta n=1 Tax=unclassified Microbacterium TaxID=2609290 RepID=UPI001CC1093E|nr:MULTISPECIES: F0F1 ATP synthase subunit delta [unclassified Microbacterium]MBZ4488522.1 F0F1 ATP synthase subunit delta [Microbacterium sp. cx-55]MCC4909665.1 F0F1 ATP synthase subunit delta [Microbacterium sp. cx-59]UGB36107.1 F0F1 ATP synthase subunit delta [Microbacterium sp. cx-55]
MGSATTHALGATTAALNAASGVDLTVASELFQAARAVSGSLHLSSALADAAAPSTARAQVVAAVFGPVLSSTSVALLSAVTAERWSSASDMIDGIEELALRAASVAAADVDLEGELFRFSRTIADNHELELALGSRLGDESAKGSLVTTLLAGRASDAAILVVSSIVRDLRDRRVRQLLTRAMSIVADQRSRTVATVITAKPLDGAQIDRLKSALAQRYGSEISLNTVIDPTIVGGLRVQIADDVIDASISARLADLRQRLAG